MSYRRGRGPVSIERKQDLRGGDPGWLVLITLVFLVGVAVLFIFYVKPF